ncbi:BMP family lipoprotein [Lentibacillus sp. Marseille-P4043]|uniref:BMP family lipoprotein n=1 Tax=Lentibacillus sp. Marseille-P4043 TaxID=2040293 RepID=UPI000D0B8791|nr:BMP family ABC transporter substrate-binding protein [Lentibacillus sp. Marseille-P4043]
MRRLFLVALVFLCACSAGTANQETNDVTSVGLLVSDGGLGDGSFSDSAFQGLEKARDELGIVFDYREPLENDFKEKLEELIKAGHDVVIGLGFNAAPAVDELAEKYPEQQFILVDAVSDKKNVTSITFKENEGGYLIGLIAGMKTKSDTVGFIGGENAPVIQNFEKGFKKGVKEVNKDAKVLVDYANTFNDDQKGAELAQKQIEAGADYIFPSAGFTGTGVLKTGQEEGIYTFGVDSDQFFLAEKTVVTSMLKNVDVALYDIIKKIVDGKTLNGENLTFGLKENGVGLAPIRLIKLTDEEQAIIDQATEVEE